MGQAKGKQKAEPPLEPWCDWNFQRLPSSTTIEARATVDAQFVNKSQERFLVDLSEDSQLTLRDAQSFRVVKQLKLSELQVDLASFKSPLSLSALRNIIVMGGTGPTFLLVRWDLKKQVFKATGIRAHKESIPTVILFGEKLLASASTDATVKIWDSEKHSNVVTLTTLKQPVTCVAYCEATGQFAIAGREGGMLIYDSRAFGFQPKKMELDRTGTHGVSSLCFDPSGGRLAVGYLYHTQGSKPEDLPITIYELEFYRLVKEWPAHATAVARINWEGGIMISSGEGEDFLRFWNPETGEKLLEFPIDAPRFFRFDPLRKGLVISTAKSLVYLRMNVNSPEEKKAMLDEKERREKEKQEQEQKEKELKEKEKKEKAEQQQQQQQQQQAAPPPLASSGSKQSLGNSSSGSPSLSRSGNKSRSQAELSSSSGPTTSG